MWSTDLHLCKPLFLCIIILFRNIVLCIDKSSTIAYFLTRQKYLPKQMYLSFLSRDDLPKSVRFKMQKELLALVLLFSRVLAGTTFNSRSGSGTLDQHPTDEICVQAKSPLESVKKSYCKMSLEDKRNFLQCSTVKGKMAENLLSTLR